MFETLADGKRWRCEEMEIQRDGMIEMEMHRDGQDMKEHYMSMRRHELQAT